MSTPEPVVNDAAASSDTRDQDLQARERFEDQLILHLERDQFVAETSRPVPRAQLGARTTAALWAMRVFCVVVSLMVVYAFIATLH